MSKIINVLIKFSRFFTSRVFYFSLGIVLAAAISTAYAVWGDAKTSGGSLTAASWDELINRLEAMDTKVNNIGAPTFAGATVASYAGNVLGGPIGANNKCKTVYAGSHFCSFDEFLRTGESAASDLWVSGVGVSLVSGTYSAMACNAWQGSLSTSDWAPTTSGGYAACTVSKKLACCK